MAYLKNYLDSLLKNFSMVHHNSTIISHPIGPIGGILLGTLPEDANR